MERKEVGMISTTSLIKQRRQTLPVERKVLAVDITYHEVYAQEKDPAWLRERIVRFAKKKGIRASAREFGCSVNTVSLWYKRAQGADKPDFHNRSRAAKHVWNRSKPELEQQVVSAWEKEHMGGHNLKHQYNLPVAGITAHRILARYQKTNLRKRKYRLSKDLRKIKAKKKCFHTVQIDGKILTDIPHFYPYYTKYELPRWQFTFTCEKSGATFYSYCNSEDSISGCTFLIYTLEHLKRYGIKVKRVKTDRGSFAVGRKSLLNTKFQDLVKNAYKAQHIAVVHKNQNADVERFHGLVEQYFYSLCTVESKSDFYRQATEKQIWFNYFRKNSGKNWKTPLEILRKDYPKVDPQVLALRPIDLNRHSDIFYYKIDKDYKPLTLEDFFIDNTEEELAKIKEQDSLVYQYPMIVDEKEPVPCETNFSY
jgi:hypothetical protein